MLENDFISSGGEKWPKSASSLAYIVEGMEADGVAPLQARRTETSSQLADCRSCLTMRDCPGWSGSIDVYLFDGQWCSWSVMQM